MLNSINPSNNSLLKQYTEMTAEESSEIISQVHRTFQEWKETSFVQRKELMKNAADVLRKNSEEYSVMMTMEMHRLHLQYHQHHHHHQRQCVVLVRIVMMTIHVRMMVVTEEHVLIQKHIPQLIASYVMNITEMCLVSVI